MTHIRAATLDDVRSVVEIHRQAFSGFTLTLLGNKFLQVLYQGFLTLPDGLLLVASAPDEERPISQRENRNLGFVAGAIRPEHFFRELRRKRAASFGMAALPALFRYPKLITERLFAALRYRGDTLAGLTDYCLLSSLGIRPNAAGRGVGSDLVARFCVEARTRGARGVYLTTDAEKNVRVRGFYARNGFDVRAQIARPNGRQMTLYTREF